MSIVPVYQRLPGYKPPLPVEIDWDHWMVRDSFFRLWMLEGAGTITTDFVGGLDCDLQGATAWDGDGIATPGGVGDGEGIISQRTPAGFPSGIGHPMSVVTGQKIFSSGNSEGPKIVATGLATSMQGFYMFLNTSNPGNQYYLRVGWQGATAIFSSGALNDDQYHTTAIVYRGDTAANTDGYLDGKKLSVVDSTSLTKTPNITPSQVALGRHVEVITGNSELKANFKFAYLFGRALSDDEVAYISANPFAPIRRRRLLIPVPSGAGGPINVPVGTVAESDQSLGLSITKSLQTGIASESDTSLAISRLKSLTISLASETDESLAIGKEVAFPLGLAAETDLSLAVSGSKLRSAGTSQESDQSLGLSATKTTATGTATETDSAQGLSSVKLLLLGTSVETDTALTIASGGFVTAVGTANETDLSLSIGAGKQKQISLAVETDSGLAIAPVRAYTMQLAAETDVSLSMSVEKSRLVGLATETDQAIAVSLPGDILIPVGLASESDIAQAIASAKQVQIGISTETDEVIALGAAKALDVGLAAETDEALGLLLPKLIQLGMATETDEALTIVFPGKSVGTKIALTILKRDITFTVLKRDITFTVLQ